MARDVTDLLVEYQAALLTPECGEDLAPDAFNIPLDKVAACLIALENLRAECQEDRSQSLPCDGSDRRPRFGRFELCEELGRGGHGIVFRAFDPVLKRDVALKIPKTETLASAELRERFLQEARAVATLSHPHLVTVHEVGEVGPACYIASHCCTGPTLAAWLKQQTSPVEPRVAALLIAVVADTVAYVHEHDILHRDLKLANVLLDFATGAPTESSATQDRLAPSLKITDFGLAKLLSGSSGRTNTGMLLGTPAYMAPEQARGRLSEVGPATDVYAVGVMLYELLAGKPPIEGETDIDTLRRVCEAVIAPLRSIRPDIPRDLEAICLKCLELEPACRYGSASQLAADLRRFLAEEPVTIRRTGALVRLVKWSRRKPLVAALSGAVALAVVLGFIGVTWQWREAERNRLAAEANFREAHQAIRAFQEVLYNDDAYDAPEFQPMRNALMKTALDYYQALLDKQAENPELRSHVAEAWYQKGFLAESQGDIAEAVRCYRQAMPMWESLVREEREVWQHRYFLAKVCDHLGGRQLKEGHLDDAAALIDEGRNLREQLCRIRPHDLQQKRELADSLLNLGALYKRQRNWERALEMFYQARDIGESLVFERPDVSQYRCDLAKAEQFIGKDLYLMERYDSAAKIAEQAATRLRQLVETKAGGPSPRTALATTLSLLGEIRGKQGRSGEAVSVLTDAEGMFLQWARDNPDSATYAGMLANNQMLLAHALQEIGDQARAHLLLEQARQAREQLTRRDPKAASRAFDLANTLYALGKWHRRFGERQTAMAAFERCQDILQALVKANSSWRQANERLVLIRLQLSELSTILDRPNDGFSAYAGH